MTETPQFLKRMIISAINAREVETGRASRLLHDEVGQILSAVGLQLDVLKLDFKGEVPAIVERVHEIQEILDQAVQQVRALSYDLNPSVVERAGLQRALDRLVGRYRNEFPGSVRLAFDQTARVPAEVAAIWYKMAELALENAIQHAKATLIEVHIRSSAKGCILEVRDNGCGFSPSANDTTPGLGLLLMEHYATQGPIDVELWSEPGQGTVLRSTWLRSRPADSPDSVNE
jgi:two-component system NarL family sensor kinase